MTSQNINLHENKSSTIESSSEVPGSSDNVSEVGHNDELNNDDDPVTSENVSQGQGDQDVRLEDLCSREIQILRWAVSLLKF